MGHFFVSCNEAARRISQAQDVPLSTGQRIGLWLHLAVCQFCRRYLRQVRFLRLVFREYHEHLDGASQEGLSTEARERLIEKLRRA